MAQANTQLPQEAPINWLGVGIALVIALALCGAAFFWLMHR